MPSTGAFHAALVTKARRRAALAFGCVAVGLAAGRYLPIGTSTAWFSCALACCAAAIFARGWTCRACLALALVLASSGWFSLRTREVGATDVSRLLTTDNPLVTIHAIALTDPRTVEVEKSPLTWGFQSQPRQRLIIDTVSIESDQGPVSASGRLWVSIQDATPLPARAGDLLRLTGSFAVVDGPMNPGEEDMRLLATQNGFAGSLTVRSASLVEGFDAPRSALSQAHSSWLRLRASLEARARDVLTRAAGDDPSHRALLLGLVMGDYDPTQRSIRDAFARQGLAHVLSISGFHLAVMAALALVLLRLTGDRGWLEPIIVAALVLAYLMIVPASSPILRSAFMVLALLGAEATGRRYDRLTILCWIAMLLLAWRPLDLWNVGFQLSLGLTAALFWLGNPFNARLWGVPIKGLVRREVGFGEKALHHLKQSVSTGLMCWMLSTPLVMFHFGLISPLAIAATILITPFIVVVLWIGYIALFIGVLFPTAANAAAWIVATLSSWSIRSVQLFDAFPISAVRIPVVPAAWSFAATLLAVYWVRQGHARDRRALAATALVGGWLVYLFSFTSGLSRSTDLRIDTFSVGSGSCHLIRSGNDAMLWDCGPMKGSGVMPPLAAAVRSLGAWRTPTVVITHPDLDHFAGLLDVVDSLGVRRVITCELFLRQAAEQPRGSAAYLVNELRFRGVTVSAAHAGDVIPLGRTTIDILSPPADASWPLDNDHSIVGAIHRHSSPETLALMTGDIQDDAIRALEQAYDLRPLALELPHHGSARSAAINFTTHLDPAIVVQSTNMSRANDPRWDIARPGRTWYCTALNGAAWVEFKSDGSTHSGSVR